MDSRIQRIFIAVLATLMPATGAFAAQPKDLELEPLVVREPERREVRVDEIDTEDFEIGAYGGILNVQDSARMRLRNTRGIPRHRGLFPGSAYGPELGETSFERCPATCSSDDDNATSATTTFHRLQHLPG
jgi:hypothetical protein